MRPRRLAAVALLCVSLVGDARESAAQPLVVDGGLVLALPAALPTGLSSGLGAGVSLGRTLAWGASASWSSATEYSLTSSVRNDDLRVRGRVALQHDAGRGSFALRLGLGATLVRESITRDQGARAGLSGDALESVAWALLPAADLQGCVAVRIVGSFSLAVSGGPSLHLVDGSVRAGWIAALGVAWHDSL